MNPHDTEVQNAVPTVARTNTAMTASTMVKARRLLRRDFMFVTNFIQAMEVSFPKLALTFYTSVIPVDGFNLKPHLLKCHDNDSLQWLRKIAEFQLGYVC